MPWSFAEMRLLCIQNGLLQQHCTNQGRRRLVACSVAFRVLGAENDHVSCRLPARRCWIRHDAAGCCWVQERASWQRIVDRGGVGVRSARRPAVAALVANRTRTAAEVPSGRANTAWHRPILAGQDSRTAGQQNGTAPSLSPPRT